MRPTGSPSGSIPELSPQAPVRLESEVPLRAELRVPVMERVRQRLERSSERVVVTDGIRAFYAGGWLWIRPSDTDARCRVEVEGSTVPEAESLLVRGVTLVRELEEALGTPDGLSDLWCDSA